MSKNTGGPAFPTTNPLGVYGDPNVGMTLRDYFAAKAMQGALAGCETRGDARGFKDLAGFSYDIADAMIAEREK